MHNNLEKYREVQGVHAPNWCFGAAKFFAGKMVGLFNPARHLNDFFRSAWYRSHPQRTSVFSAWNSPISPHPNFFNAKVIRPSILLQEAGIAMISPLRDPVQFELFRRVEKAEDLLRKGAPVVAAVDLAHANTGGRGGQDHYITLVMDKARTIWMVDPWLTSARASVVTLPGGILSRQVTVQMNAGRTTIPPGRPYFGYFRVLSGSPLKVKLPF